MNDGDILYFDRNDPECPPRDKAWWSRGYFENLKKEYREGIGMPDGLWPDVKNPWYTWKGLQERNNRFYRIKKESESKYNAPWYTKGFQEQWVYRLYENIDNDTYIK